MRTDTDFRGDTAYQGIAKIHATSITSKKRKRGEALSRDDRRFNHEHSSVRIVVEHVISRLKRFRIIADRYRNRRKRFGLRFKLIAGMYNYELQG